VQNFSFEMSEFEY